MGYLEQISRGQQEGKLLIFEIGINGVRESWVKN